MISPCHKRQDIWKKASWLIFTFFLKKKKFLRLLALYQILWDWPLIYNYLLLWYSWAGCSFWESEKLTVPFFCFQRRDMFGISMFFCIKDINTNAARALHSYDAHILFSVIRVIRVRSLQQSAYIICSEWLPEKVMRSVSKILCSSVRHFCSLSCHGKEKPQLIVLFGLFATLLHLNEISLAFHIHLWTC